MVDAALFSSSCTLWQTPAEVLARTRSVAPIALDPCTVRDNPTQAARFYTAASPGRGGLSASWRVPAGSGLVYVNPPYGRGLTAQWTRKAAREVQLGVEEMILLLPARTDAIWFQELMPHLDAICFWAGRLRFVGALESAPFPSVVCYAGPRRWRFMRNFRGAGFTISRAGGWDGWQVASRHAF